MKKPKGYGLLCAMCFTYAFVNGIPSLHPCTGEGTMHNATYPKAQEQLIHEIEQELRDTAYLTGIARLSSRVRAALLKTPRHLFVHPSEIQQAYLNRPLPIGAGQTISQPFIVAFMTELLDVQPHDNVLEIGTGSGYQAAVLSHLAGSVCTVEVIPLLAKQAQERFKQLGYRDILTHIGNGAEGWPQHSPYTKIIVTAAAETVPPALLEQLAPKGKMVMPLGPQWDSQMLTLIEKDASGHVTHKNVLSVRFVPFEG